MHYWKPTTILKGHIAKKNSICQGFFFLLCSNKQFAKQHDQTKCCDKDAPATVRVWFVIGFPLAIAPLHCTTVPFSLTGELSVRVEVISVTLVFITVMGLAVFVKVATKSMLSHCGGETPLQSTRLPRGVLPSTNQIRVLPEMNGSTIQSRAIPCMTVQV